MGLRGGKYVAMRVMLGLASMMWDVTSSCVMSHSDAIRAMRRLCHDRNSYDCWSRGASGPTIIRLRCASRLHHVQKLIAG